MREARQAIVDGRYAEFTRRFTDLYTSGDGLMPAARESA
jgi:hypothetical protein